jgi:hypothetical protein
VIVVFQFTLGKELRARWKNLRTCFKRESDAQNCAPSGEERRKQRKYLYFDQLLYLLPHIEDRATESNLSTEGKDSEEDGNISRSKEESTSKCSTKETTQRFI